MDRQETGQNLFCSGVTHYGTLKIFARSITLPRGQFEEEARTAGWVYNEQTRKWQCAECFANEQASSTTVDPELPSGC